MKRVSLWAITFFIFGFCSLTMAEVQPDEVAPPEAKSEETHIKLSYKDLDEADRRVIAAELANQFSVMVSSRTSEIFEVNASVSGGQGTGFIVEINEEKDEAFVVTNRHVAESSDLEGQRLTLSLTVQGERDEVVAAEPFYISPPDEEDLAILKFKPSDVKRAQIQSAPIPTFEQMAEMYNPGDALLAHGNPLGERNSVTFGTFSQVAGEHFGGIYFKTDASINPGNSGGPLLRLGRKSILDPNGDAPYVIGINTAKNSTGEGMGYAIPTFVWLPKYLWARKGGPERAKGYLYLRARPVTTKIPIEAKLSKTVDSEVHDVLGASYFKKFRTILMIDQAQKDSGLQQGDYILSAEGQVIGPDLGRLEDLVSETDQATLKFRVLRDRKVISVDVPIINSKIAQNKRNHDFVLLSGMFIQDLLPKQKAELTHGQAGVIVRRILEDGFSRHLKETQGLVSNGSLITSVQIKGKDFPIQNLDNLKAALREAMLNEWIWVRVHNIRMSTNLADGSQSFSLDPESMNVYLWVHEVITDADFSLAELRKKIDPTRSIAGTRNWRTITGMDCRRPLADLGSRLMQPSSDFQI